MSTQLARMIGRGIGFPPRVDASGRLQWTAGDDNVRESLRIILLTEPGERLMRDDFGCGLRRLLFEPNTVATRRHIQQQITESIARWERRVRLDEVSVEETADAQRVLATIRYTLRSTGVREQVALTIELEGAA